MSRRSLFALFFGLGFTLFLNLVNLAPALALGGTQLPLNEPAPDFALPSNSGDREISLSDYPEMNLIQVL